MKKIINVYDLPQLIDTFHGNNEPNAKEILDERSIEILNIDIQVVSYLNPGKKMLLLLYSKDKQWKRRTFFVDTPSDTGKIASRS